MVDQHLPAEALEGIFRRQGARGLIEGRPVYKILPYDGREVHPHVRGPSLAEERKGQAGERDRDYRCFHSVYS